MPRQGSSHGSCVEERARLLPSCNNMVPLDGKAEDCPSFPEAVSLSWRNLCVRVPRVPESTAWLPSWCRRSHEKKVVVDNATGSVEGGTFLAVVGASGSGKTTLLAAISKRLTGRDVAGEVLLNGRPASAGVLSAACGYVPQRDLATETLTAAEHLSFMAAMLLDARTPAASRARRVRVLLADLGLTGCQHTRLSDMSGGERRRLAVAAQLLVSPAVLVLDEPCSGLDSMAARSLLEMLRREADRGRAVVCTVHQAAPDVLALFNAILVLAGGRVAYHGPMQGAYHFLTRAGVHCPEECPSLLGVLHRLFDSSPSALKEARAACDLFARSRAELHGDFSESDLNREPEEASNIVRPGFFTQFCWLAWRGMIDARRNYKEHATQLSIFLATSVILATAFVNVSPSSMAGVQGARGLLYLVTSEVVFTHSYAVFYVFPGELPVFLREAQARLYSPAAYYTAKNLLLVPRALIQPLLFLSIVQSQVDVTAAGGFPTYCWIVLLLFLASLAATAYGCMLSALCASSEMAILITMPIDFLSLLSTGIYHTLNSMPVYASWLKYVSIFYYIYESLSISFWSNVKSINCDPNVPCLSDGKEVLEDAGFSPDGIANDFVGIGSIILVCHVIGFLGVLKRSRQQSTY